MKGANFVLTSRALLCLCYSPENESGELGSFKTRLHACIPGVMARVSEDVSVTGSCLPPSMNVRYYYSIYPWNSRNDSPDVFAVSTDFAPVSKKYFTRANVYGFSFLRLCFVLFSLATKPYDDGGSGGEPSSKKKKKTKNNVYANNRIIISI